ncbi:putative WD repeat-containing protein [Colletotrichum sidae]|uniref:Putative WD repeat-containing protein n=1 Tax=Colletotrichum sidae TaxID=1347389 RepID=A0A4R8TGB4_9PEZI|nr:putative WD repeat-containing protein [Colletotrichum sidae]
MRPRTSETASLPSHAQVTHANSNQHHAFAPAPPVEPPHDLHSHNYHQRQPDMQQSPPQPFPLPNQSQTPYPNSDPLYYHPNFPVIPASYYHQDPNVYPHDQYDEYDDYDDDDENDDNDADHEDDEDMDMSDSDGGAPLGHVMTVTSILSPMPENEAALTAPEPYPGAPGHDSVNHVVHDAHLAPMEPPTHMLPYWNVAPFDPAGPHHPTPLNTITFHPMLNAGVMEDDDDDDDDVLYPPVSDQLQQLQAAPAVLHDDDEAAWQAAGPPAISNPNPSTLGPENLGLTEFLKDWAWRNRYQARGPSPGIQSVNRQAARKVTRVQYADLEGDRCDAQGIDWEDLGVTRQKARERRSLDYKNYTNRTDSDVWAPNLPDRIIRNTENFFKFRRMDIRQNVHLAHFQLRNILAGAGRSRAFYPGQRVVHQINPVSGQSEVAMDLSSMVGVQISTLDANCGVLIAGTFNGEYCMRNIHSQDKKYTEGQITSHISGITNHLQICESRTSSSPLAAFASNDQGFRVMDVATEKFILDTQYGCPINCSALSADRRLRAMVGDNYNVIITSADTGEVLHELEGHRDFGFACDWSDNGWTVATGFQDMSVKIWDARKWTNADGSSAPVTTIRSELAGVRSLRFSPVGSGPPVLVAAEEADFVNIVDAQTFTRKQTFDVFGEIGGAAFANDGEDLNILCMDRTRGGLVQLERCDLGFSGAFEPCDPATSSNAWWKSGREGMLTFGDADRPRLSAPRQRTVALFDDLEPF